MKFTKGLLKHSVIALGVLLSIPKDADAKPPVPAKFNTPAPTTQSTDYSLSVTTGDRSLTSLAIATPSIEVETPSPEHSSLTELPLKVALVAPKDIPSAPYPESPAIPQEYSPANPGTQPPADQTPSSTDSQDSTSPDAADPELGNLLLREAELSPEQNNDTVFLLLGANYLRSNNVLLDDFDPVNDQLVSLGATLLAIPSLGPQTDLIASLSGNITRYSDLSELDYNDLEFQVGVQQFLFSNTYGEISLSNQRFFDADSGDRFLNDYSTRLTLSHRDQLASRLNLDSFYQLRLSFTDPSDRSRVSNSLGVSLNYDLQDNLAASLDYQFVLTDFTRQDRNDAYHQITAQLNCYLSRNTRANLFAGFSFGDSSDPDINFNSSIFGISINTSVSLF
ncbi:MAG TPA: outer membrane beta-barrel protein [Crinalium sp.]